MTSNTKYREKAPALPWGVVREAAKRPSQASTPYETTRDHLIRMKFLRPIAPTYKGFLYKGVRVVLSLRSRKAGRANMMFGTVVGHPYGAESTTWVAVDFGAATLDDQRLGVIDVHTPLLQKVVN